MAVGTHRGTFEGSLTATVSLSDRPTMSADNVFMHEVAPVGSPVRPYNAPPLTAQDLEDVPEGLDQIAAR